MVTGRIRNDLFFPTQPLFVLVHSHTPILPYSHTPILSTLPYFPYSHTPILSVLPYFP
jgi:hypothetical protein